MNEMFIGCKMWIVPDGYVPDLVEGEQPGPTGYISHECACVLNTTSKDAQLELTIYFEDRDPIIINDIVVAARRSKHLRMDELKRDGEPAIPRGCPYSLLVKSDVPIVVQMSRLDTTQANMAFLSTMGYAID